MLISRRLNIDRDAARILALARIPQGSVNGAASPDWREIKIRSYATRTRRAEFNKHIRDLILFVDGMGFTGRFVLMHRKIRFPTRSTKQVRLMRRQFRRCIFCLN